MSNSDQLSPSAQKTKHYFDQLDAPLSTFARGYRRLLARYYSLLIPRDCSVLELGCGTGELLKHIPAARRVGQDFSSQQIERAKRNAPGIEFTDDTIDQIAHRGEIFEYIILSDTVNYVDDAQALLAGLRTISSPATRLIINIPNNLWKPIFGLAHVLGLRATQHQSSWLSGQDVRNLLQLADWDVVKSQPRALVPYAGGWIEKAINRWIAPLLPWFCLTQFIVARPSHFHATNSAPVARSLAAAQKTSVSVVVPARNETGNIEAAITRTPTMGAWTEFIFIEGGSNDHTWEEIQRVQKAYPDHRIKILQQSGKGKGNAVREGFAEAKGDLLMILDADLTMPPEELPKYYEAITHGHCEFANGSRLIYPMDEEAMRFLNMIANKSFGLIFSWLLGQPIKDTLCGTKVLRRSAYEKIAANRAYFGDFDPYGDFDLLFGADRLNLKIRDIPIRYRDRTYGTTNINRWTGGLLLLRMVIFAARKLKFV